MVWTPDRIEAWEQLGLRPAVAVWTAPQTARFLDYAYAHRLYAAFHLIALRGLRRGEAAGLRWCDIDLDKGLALITWQNQYRQGRVTICPPKIAGSVRRVLLDRTTVAALRVHKLRQDDERCEHRLIDTGYVFTDHKGLPLHPDRLSYAFRALAADSGLPPVRLHDLRRARPRWRCRPGRT